VESRVPAAIALRMAFVMGMSRRTARGGTDWARSEAVGAAEQIATRAARPKDGRTMDARGKETTKAISARPWPATPAAARTALFEKPMGVAVLPSRHWNRGF